MPKKHKNEEHVDSHRWIVSYADFITLLFAFFVVMYAISSVNVSKFKAVSAGMNSAFKSKGDKPAAQEGMNGADGTKQNEKAAFEALDNALAQLQDDDYQVNSHKGWIELNIKAGALFDSGNADLRPTAILKLMKLADIIKKMPYPIALEGYTDNVPIDSPQFPSNWELSSARASALARSLTISGVDQNRITVAGYGEQYPVADNMTEEGRAKNRRVNLIILKDKSVPRLLNPQIGIDSNKEKAAAKEEEVVFHGKSQLQPILKEK